MAKEIIAFGRERLSGFQTPKRVIFLSYAEMPINYSGKILKKDLRKLLLEHLSREESK